jgi:hypothetical protein
VVAAHVPKAQLTRYSSGDHKCGITYLFGEIPCSSEELPSADDTLDFLFCVTPRYCPTSHFLHMI